MRNLSAKEFIHYLILFGTQIAIWAPLMDFFEGVFWYTVVAWFIISVVLDKALHKYFKLD